MAGSLHHQNIVDVYDYGEHPDEHGRTTPYLVMPLIDGVSLSAMLKSRVALPVGETMSIIGEMASALAAAHEAGIVHRDLKPGNVMLTPSGRVMILDFGIARSTEGESLTQTGALIGTADYLSPEQAAGRQATYASDLYALGVVAYTCLTGVPPFHRETDIATALGARPGADSRAARRDPGVGHRPAHREPARQGAGAATRRRARWRRSPASWRRRCRPTWRAATDPEATQPGVARSDGRHRLRLDASTQTAPAMARLAAGAATDVSRWRCDATDEVLAESAIARRRTVLVSSALLALAAIVFALMYVGGRDQVEVPDVRKMTSVEAASTLAAKGFEGQDARRQRRWLQGRRRS